MARGRDAGEIKVKISKTRRVSVLGYGLPYRLPSALLNSYQIRDIRDNSDDKSSLLFEGELT